MVVEVERSTLGWPQCLTNFIPKPRRLSSSSSHNQPRDSTLQAQGPMLFSARLQTLDISSLTLPDTECVEDQDQTPISHISPSTAERSAILDIISQPSSNPCSPFSAIRYAVSAVRAQIA